MERAKTCRPLNPGRPTARHVGHADIMREAIDDAAGD